MGLIYDGLMYERIYEILKDRIESGVLPAGTKLPSRDSLLEHRAKPFAAYYPC